MIDMLDGFEVVGTSVSAAAAISWLRRPESGCDVLIVQENLPDGSGISVVTECRRHPGQYGRVVLMGSSIPEVIAERYFRLGVSEIVPDGDFQQLAECLLAKYPMGGS